MKIALLIGLAALLITPVTEAQPGQPYIPSYSGFDTCYEDARSRFYNIEGAAKACRGVYSSLCYVDARRSFANIEHAAQLCQGFVSNLCYEDARRRFASIEQAVQTCQMTHPVEIR